MANEQYAFLSRARVPSREQWQAAITASGHDLVLYPSMQTMKDRGFAPCTLRGRESGVEIYYWELSNPADKDLFEHFDSIRKGRDACISFRWGGDFGACLCACIGCLALASQFGAIVSYEGEPAMSEKELKESIAQCWGFYEKGE